MEHTSYSGTMKRESIAFSCASEGYGHVARVVALAPILMEAYELYFFAAEPVEHVIREHIPDARIIPIAHLGFVIENHRIDYLSTTALSLKNIIGQLPEFPHLVRMLRSLSLTALISDFEPITAYAAWLAGIPVLNLNHPGIVLKFRPTGFEAIMAQAVARMMMPVANKHLICSFYEGDVGPILRSGLKGTGPTRGEHILVYTKKDSRRQLLAALERFKEVEFRVFPDPHGSFDQSLLTCRAMIGPAGHQSLSEAICLRKPTLAFAQRGQFEQQLNARMLERSGWGSAGTIDAIEDSVSSFLEQLDSYPRKQDEHFQFTLEDDTGHAIAEIRSFISSCSKRHPKRGLYTPRLLSI